MALVQGKATDVSAASAALTLTSSVTAGNIIVAGVSAFGASTMSTPTTSGTAVLGSWAKFLASNLVALSCLGNIFVAKVTTGGTLTVTSSSTTAGGIGMAVGEFDGSWGSTQIDGTLTSSGSGSGTAVAAASITPTAGDLMIGFQFNDGGAISQTPGTNYKDGVTTDHVLNSATGNVDCSMEWWLDSAGSATTAPWTLGTFQTWGAIAGALKPTSGGTAFIPRPGLTIRQAVNRAGTY